MRMTAFVFAVLLCLDTANHARATCTEDEALAPAEASAPVPAAVPSPQSALDFTLCADCESDDIFDAVPIGILLAALIWTIRIPSRRRDHFITLDPS